MIVKNSSLAIIVKSFRANLNNYENRWINCCCSFFLCVSYAFRQQAKKGKPKNLIRDLNMATIKQISYMTFGFAEAKQEKKDPSNDLISTP